MTRRAGAWWIVALLSLSTPAAAADLLGQQAWVQYAQRFLLPEGRLRDDHAGDHSHSEGQGTALLLAERYGDQARFATIWQWTHANLAVRGDALLAWRWDASAGDHVPDRNNATDGDLLVAWALAEAAQRWNVADYRTAAIAIARTLRTKLLRTTPLGPVLLPGEHGFESAAGIVVNLSYAILPAYRTLATVDPDPAWTQLTEAHLRLVERAGFGRFMLPPDWLFVPKGWDPANNTPPLAPWQSRPARFGYDAIRVPLYLAWGGADGQLLGPFLKFWGFFEPLPFHPAWTDLSEDAVPLSDMPPGFRSIQKLAEAAQAGPAGGPAPGLSQDENNYYSASLTLLAQLAWQDRGF